MNIEENFLQMMAQAQVENPELLAQANGVQPAGTVRPGAMEGEMRAIPQTGVQRVLEKTGLTLEQFGKELDKLGKISTPLGEFGLRDILPFVGYTEEREDPLTGKTEVVESGTPKALQMLGRGESLVKGKGMTTELKKEGKDLVADVATTLPVAKVGKKVAGAVKETLETPPKGAITIGAGAPRVDSIERFPMGPTSIKPKVIAEGKPLYRETNVSGLDSLLASDKQFDYGKLFVADNEDIALGQGENVGVKIRFRPNSLSGEVNKKPGTGILAGQEYVTDVIAPMAIELFTVKSEKQLKNISLRAKRNLAEGFDKQELDSGEIVFTRKGAK